MNFNYKGYNAEYGFVVDHLTFVESGVVGYCYLKSDLINCKSPVTLFDGEEKTILNIYKQYFKDKVDKIYVERSNR